MTKLTLLRLLSLALMLSVFTIPTDIYAADQTDERNRAPIKISLSILPSMQITTVGNIQLDIRDRSTDTNFSEPFCVRSNGSGKFTVIAYGSVNSQNQFVLSNQQGETLAYTVSFQERSSRNQHSVLKPGVPSQAFDSISQVSDCNEGASYNINFKSSDLEAVTSGLFSGALTLLVSPL